MKEEELVLRIETPKQEPKAFDFPDVEDPAQAYICDSCQ